MITALFALMSSFFFMIKLKMTKIVMVYFGILMSNFMLILLAISDEGWRTIGTIMASFFSMLGVIFLALINKKVNTAVKDTKEVAKSIDGLLHQKSLADKALGRIEGIDKAEKETAIGDARELQMIKEQQLKDQVPPQTNQQNHNTGGDVKEVKNVKDEIIQALEKEIHQKGDEIQKVVETKGSDIQEKVEQVPDEVVKKLPPIK